MEPNIWGPGAWTFLHSITLNYPKEPTQYQKKIYSDFFNLLGKILPCQSCNNHYIKLNNELPVQFNLNSRENLVRWLFEIHNKINESLKKKRISYDEFINIYKNLYNNKNESITYYKKKNKLQKKIIYILSTLFIISLLFSYFYIKLYLRK